MKLFVYGTLKKGSRNHHYLRNNDFLGKGITEERYKYNNEGLPKVIKTGNNKKIKGELYRVNKDKLKLIDTLESHPLIYKREKINIISKDIIKKAWCYFYNL